MLRHVFFTEVSYVEEIVQTILVSKLNSPTWMVVVTQDFFDIKIVEDKDSFIPIIVLQRIAY